MIVFVLRLKSHEKSQYLVVSSVLVAINLVLASECKSQSFIEKQCKLGLDFKSISEFNQFIDEFLDLSQAQLETGAKKSLGPCTRDIDAIKDLKSLITRQEVCDMQKIDELIAYHKRYFVGRGFLRKRKPITYRFFSRYAIQVALVCKKNLLKNLVIAKAELKDRSMVFEKAKESVYNDEPSIKSNIKLIEEQPDVPVSSNLKPQEDAELTLSEYREALIQLRLPEDILTFDTNECKNHKARETLISSDKVQTFFKPALICHQLHRYYAGSVLSIAKLANIGYMASIDDIDAQIADNPMIKDWLIAVQVCEPMMHMRSNETRYGDMVIVDTCSEKVSAIEPMVYEDSFEDLDNSLLDVLVPKSEATRFNAQKIMRSTLKKMAKSDLRKQLRSGTNKRSIFKKSLSVTIFRSGRNHESLLSRHHLTGANAGVSTEMLSKFSIELTGNKYDNESTNQQAVVSHKEAYDILMEVVAKSDEQQAATMCSISEDNGIDEPVSFDLMSSVASTLLVMAIMMVFEWIFFIVMTVAARMCHELYFNFENLLTFPPKVLSWSDADFARYTDELENMDEDDLFDYEELNPEEQRQRQLLAKVFGRPPPMLFKV